MQPEARPLLMAIGTALAPLKSAMAADPNLHVGKGFMAKDGKSVHGVRIYTDKNGQTHVGAFKYDGKPATGDADSLVPKGCTSFFEGPAVGVLVRSFPSHFTTGYHNDPAHQHQLTFMIEGTAGGGCMDGSSFILEPGSLSTVEDPTGTGHTAHDEGGTGFVQLFISMPSSE